MNLVAIYLMAVKRGDDGGKGNKKRIGGPGKEGKIIEEVKNEERQRQGIIK